MARLNTTLTLLIVLFLLAACSPSKLLERDKVDAAFAKAAKKLERDPKGSSELIQVVSRAYSLLQQESQQELSRLRSASSGFDPYGEREVALLEDLAYRRQKMHELRLKAKRVIKVTEWDREMNYERALVDARTRAAELLLADADRFAVGAQEGDRFAAREAWQLLERRQRYATATAEIRSMQAEMRDIGTLRVAVIVDGLWPSHNRQLRDELGRKLSGDWISISTSPREKADVYADLQVFDLSRSVPRYQIQNNQYERRLESRIEVGKDSLGQPIYQTKVEVVRANVQTSTSLFRKDLSARLSIETHDGDLVYGDDERSFVEVLVVRNLINGDRRALEGNLIPGESGSVPSEGELLNLAIDKLAWDLPTVNIDRLLSKQFLASN